MDFFGFIEKIGGPTAVIKVLMGQKSLEEFLIKAEPELKNLIIEKAPVFKPKIIDFINKLEVKKEGESKTGILITENSGNIYLTCVMLDDNSQITRAFMSYNIEEFILQLDLKKMLENGTATKQS